MLPRLTLRAPSLPEAWNRWPSSPPAGTLLPNAYAPGRLGLPGPWRYGLGIRATVDLLSRSPRQAAFFEPIVQIRLAGAVALRDIPLA